MSPLRFRVVPVAPLPVQDFETAEDALVAEWALADPKGADALSFTVVVPGEEPQTYEEAEGHPFDPRLDATDGERSLPHFRTGGRRG